MALAQLSVIVLYLRIFTIHPHFRRLMLSIAVIAICVFSFSFFPLTFCQPGLYNPHIYKDSGMWCKMADPTPILYVNGSFHTLTNLLLMIVPLPLFWALQIPRRRRILICILFGCGFL